MTISVLGNGLTVSFTPGFSLSTTVSFRGNTLVICIFTLTLHAFDLLGSILVAFSIFVFFLQFRISRDVSVWAQKGIWPFQSTLSSDFQFTSYKMTSAVLFCRNIKRTWSPDQVSFLNVHKGYPLSGVYHGLLSRPELRCECFWMQAVCLPFSASRESICVKHTHTQHWLPSLWTHRWTEDSFNGRNCSACK